ncbi:hypothetical protein J6TS1_10220 [Siminovitchia terrae]|uniref:YkoP-like domain-containing protein n=1 Tax=Siminovitchia terrae TaxID=1914933 RepID=A0ABQ4KV37_SIMTE|nr:hypothetical protein [Siminovitchia terrae]GIN89081.1 hypothetical protein J22TS1_01320 [Siminovitchia terrae]GIN95152.1 hypothetical protein J6TS1_10220 [Siminovitchia terrae]
MKIRQFCISGWNVVDPIYFHLTRLHHIKNKCGKKTIMRVRLTRYQGRNVVLSDGTEICKNDLLVKVHLHNVKLLSEIMQYKNDLRKAKIIYSSVKSSLPDVVDYIQSSKLNDEIKGLIGITTLYKGCKRLGFEPYSIKNPVYKKFKQTALLPIYFLSSNNQANHELPEPMYLFMSKDTLFQKYGSV